MSGYIASKVWTTFYWVFIVMGLILLLGGCHSLAVAEGTWGAKGLLLGIWTIFNLALVYVGVQGLRGR